MYAFAGLGVRISLRQFVTYPEPKPSCKHEYVNYPYCPFCGQPTSNKKTPVIDERIKRLWESDKDSDTYLLGEHEGLSRQRHRAYIFWDVEYAGLSVRPEEGYVYIIGWGYPVQDDDGYLGVANYPAVRIDYDNARDLVHSKLAEFGFDPTLYPMTWMLYAESNSQ